MIFGSAIRESTTSPKMAESPSPNIPVSMTNRSQQRIVVNMNGYPIYQAKSVL